MPSTTSLDDLQNVLVASGISFLSIRCPSKGDQHEGQWIANSRKGELGWICGAPKQTILEAVADVINLQTNLFE